MSTSNEKAAPVGKPEAAQGKAITQPGLYESSSADDKHSPTVDRPLLQLDFVLRKIDELNDEIAAMRPYERAWGRKAIDDAYEVWFTELWRIRAAEYERTGRVRGVLEE